MSSDIDLEELIGDDSKYLVSKFRGNYNFTRVWAWLMVKWEEKPDEWVYTKDVARPLRLNEGFVYRILMDIVEIGYIKLVRDRSSHQIHFEAIFNEDKLRLSEWKEHVKRGLREK